LYGHLGNYAFGCKNWQADLASSGRRHHNPGLSTPFGWDQEQVIELLDSIYDDYLIGIILLFPTQIVGTCDGDTKKIIYNKTPSSAATPAKETPKP